MQVLDLAYNLLTGDLPACLLDSVQELFLPGNALSGSLPTPAPASRLVTLYANLQAGGGFSGATGAGCASAAAAHCVQQQ